MYKLITIIFVVSILAMTIKGLPQNPKSQELASPLWKDEGPFEVSPERGRFALTYSIVENHSLYFDLPIARFVTPDLGYVNGKYVSLFAPAVSYLAIPGYLIGYHFGLSQVGAFATSAFFAILNFILVRKISRILGAGLASSTVGGLLFLFGSPAFAYATTLYQHHISTFLILLGFFSLMCKRSFITLGLFWFLFAASIPVDYPNLFLMLPLAFFAITQTFMIIRHDHKPQLQIWIPAILAVFTMLLPLAFFFGFNKASYGNPLQFSGTIKSVQVIGEDGLPFEKKVVERPDQPKKSKTAVGFFKTRSLLNGIYTHVFSSERGIVFYTPVLIIGMLGLFFLYRSNSTVTAVILGIILMDLVLYSLWGDPWGGWAFGSRYSIPAYSLLAICLGVFLEKTKRYLWVTITVFLIAIYSVGINTLGALTTNRIPPKAEAKYLETLSNRHERYSYDRNLEMLLSGQSKSVVFQSYVHDYFDAKTLFIIVFGLINFFLTIPFLTLIINSTKHD